MKVIYNWVDKLLTTVDNSWKKQYHGTPGK